MLLFSFIFIIFFLLVFFFSSRHVQKQNAMRTIFFTYSCLGLALVWVFFFFCLFFSLSARQNRKRKICDIILSGIFLLSFWPVYLDNFWIVSTYLQSSHTHVVLMVTTSDVLVFNIKTSPISRTSWHETKRRRIIKKKKH